jgi:acyl-CoA thioester hydrolase
MDNRFNLSTFNHTIKEKVKFHEVDMMNIVNNAVYLNYFEDARIKYLQDLRTKYQLNDIMENGVSFIMAHNEVDYLLPAMFDDELHIYTKIEWVKNTSFSFRHIIINSKSNLTIAVGGGIFVQITLSTKEPQKLSNEFIQAIQDFEGGVLKKRE